MTTKIDQQMIRKAAIVVAELDPDAADVLLDGFPEEIAQQVRYESMFVDEISAEEKAEVLAEFMQRRTSSAPAPEPASGDELVLSAPPHPGSPRLRKPAVEPQPAAPVPPPFHFLNEAPPEMLAPFFEQESPQIIAVVLSHLEPTRASAILRELPVDLQATVIQRLVDLGHTDPETLRAIESRLQTIVQDQLQTMSSRRIGLSAAKAILAASDSANSAEVLKALKSRSATMAKRLGVDIQPEPAPVEPAAPSFDQVYAPVSSQPASIELGAKPSPATVVAKPTPAEAQAPPEPCVPLADFVKFNDALLGQVLADTEPQTVLLALAGASNAVTQRFYRGLSKREINDLQRRIRDLQPVLVRDIDAAQKKLGATAARVISQGQQGGSRLSASA